MEQKSTSKEGRLGKCEVCNFVSAKYTCPKCEVKTCRLECLRIHKKELDCNGIRNKTKFIPFKQITEADLMNDYTFLESCTNYTTARRTDKIKRYTARNRSLPVPLMKLKKAAADSERQIKLDFLLPNFDKHKTNTTYYDWASKAIYWCIEWCFINAKSQIFIDERCCESKTMSELIEKYFNEGDEAISSLDIYQSKRLNNIVLLLKAEGIRRSQHRFYVMDKSKTLQMNLQGKAIVEYPVIYVAFDTEINKYEIINDKKKSVADETRKHKSHYFPMKRSKHENERSNFQGSKDVNSRLDLIQNGKPVNFLFSNENDSSDGNSSDEVFNSSCIKN